MALSANRRLILRIGSPPNSRACYLFKGIIPPCKKDLLFNIEE
jgi:hypothetical protein